MCSAKGGAFFGKISGTRRLYLLTGFLLLAAMPKQLQLQSILLHYDVVQPKFISGPFQSPWPASRLVWQCCQTMPSESKFAR